MGYFLKIERCAQRLTQGYEGGPSHGLLEKLMKSSINNVNKCITVTKEPTHLVC